MYLVIIIGHVLYYVLNVEPCTNIDNIILNQTFQTHVLYFEFQIDYSTFQ